MKTLTCLMATAICVLPISTTAQTVEVGSDDFGAAVREYLLENPEVIFEAVDIYNARQEQAARDAAQNTLGESADQIYDEQYAIVLGNPDADITVVEFSDYNCGYCKRSHGEVEKLVEADPNVKVIIQHFPAFGGETSEDVARVIMAAEIALGKDDAKALHDAIFESSGQWNKANALDLSDTIGLDRAAIEATLESDQDALETAITARLDLGHRLGFQGTPGFVIGDQILPGYAPADAMAQFVELARQNSNQ